MSKADWFCQVGLHLCVQVLAHILCHRVHDQMVICVVSAEPSSLKWMRLLLQPALVTLWGMHASVHVSITHLRIEQESDLQ